MFAATNLVKNPVEVTSWSW